MLDADCGHDRLPVAQHGAEVALHGCGKAFQLTSVEDLGLGRESGRFEPAAQLRRARFQTELPVDHDSRRDDAHGTDDGQRDQHTPGAALT